MPGTTSRGYVYPVPADAANGAANIQSAMASVDSDIAACVPDLAVTSFGDLGALQAGAYSSAALPGVSNGFVVVIRPRVTITPTKFVWGCNTQSGNYDLAIINATTRARIWSLGATACPVAGEIVKAIGAPPTLTAGVRYGLVFSADNTTLKLVGGPVQAGTTPTLYDGTIAAGYAAAAYPVPVTFPVWAAASFIPALSLRA